MATSWRCITGTLLEELGKRTGMLGVIFRKAQNKIQDPAKLRRLIVDLIDKEQWSSLSADVKGDAYEGLLQKNAEDVKGGAGQYFTPRALIAAMVECHGAAARADTVCDPACGTGGFLLAAHDYIAKTSRPGPGAEEAAQERHIVRHRAGGQRHTPLRDEPAAARHRRRRPRTRSARRHQGRAGRQARRIRDGAGQSALRQKEQRHHRQRGGRADPRNRSSSTATISGRAPATSSSISSSTSSPS